MWSARALGRGIVVTAVVELLRLRERRESTRDVQQAEEEET